MSGIVEAFIAPLTEEVQPHHHALPSAWSTLASLEPSDFALLIEALHTHAEELDQALSAPQWQLLFAELLPWCERRREGQKEAEIPEKLAKFYRSTAGLNLPRYQLLTCLATLADGPALQQFVTLMQQDPPTDLSAATTPFLPLMRPQGASCRDVLFPALFDCLANPLLAPVVMDLANYCAREQPELPHPAADRVKKIIQLLGGVTRHLEDLQQRTGSFEEVNQVSAESVSHAIAMAISLCDALALIGDQAAIAALSHAMDLKHRRVQLEAASALARLDIEAGRKTMLQLASEPSVRLRVLQYAEELGIEDQVDEQYTTGAALGEAELISFLADARQYGVPPSSCELVEATTLYWPGYEEPRECYLFRFTYQAIGEGGGVISLSNLGMAGPLTYAFQADISDFSVPDAWAIFAGWQAEHAEISQWPVDGDFQLDEVEQQLQQALQEGPYAEVTVLLAGRFFEDRVIVATATKQDRPGLALSAADGVAWFPQTSETRPMRPEDVFSIYKGRKLLASFNDVESA